MSHDSFCMGSLFKQDFTIKEIYSDFFVEMLFQKSGEIRLLNLLTLFKLKSKSRRNQVHHGNDQKLQTSQKFWKYIKKYFDMQKINHQFGIAYSLLFAEPKFIMDYKLQSTIKGCKLRVLILRVFSSIIFQLVDNKSYYIGSKFG